MASVAEHELESYLAPFGLDAFRPGQKEVISTILSGQDCLCVMPTGGGKSLCYQLPAVARQRLTLVVSPLIALMKDQVDQLTALGLRATFINSTIPPDEQYARLEQMAAGYYHLVYVVPERFRSPRFLDAVRRSQVHILAIDEAHCVSEWGHDFRPDYARLGQFREQLGNPPTIALTATATAVVRRDIVELLHLNEPQSFVTGFARPNLHYEVQSLSSQREKDDVLEDFLRRTPGSGIIYTSSRKRCDEVAHTIFERTGRPTGVYHAGMMSDERHAAQDAFMEGRTEIVVATNAFGMGVDKANVRFVVHYNLPGSVEAYYQEAGLAGRDGQPSHCLLMYTAGDRYIHEFFIESAYPSPEVVQRVYNYLRGLQESPIELTLQEIKERLALQIGAEGVGACEKLLEKAGVLERLEAVENLATVRLNSDLPTLVDLLPPQAKVKRRVLRAVEAVVRDQRRQWVYLHPRDLALRAEMDPTPLARTLRELAELDSFDYLPPFRGRAIVMRERERAFDELEIDFEASERRKAAEYEKLNLMMRYAQSRDCRQREILHYFGEADAAHCHHCDNCAAKGRSADRWVKSGTNNTGMVEAVRIVLSGVARARGRCGKQLVAQMLCGSTAKGVTRNRLDRLSTFGLLGHLTQVEVGELIDALLATQYLEQTDADKFRPVLQLTPLGTEVMSGRTELRDDLPLPVGLFEKLRARSQKPEVEQRASRRQPDVESEVRDQRSGIQNPKSEIGNEPLDADLLQRLRLWREQTSRALNVPAYVVLTNATLDELARSAPQSREALLGVKGIGEAKLRQHGDALLGILAGGQAPKQVETAVEPSSADDFDGNEAPSPSEPVSGDGVADRTHAQPNHYWTWRLLSAGFRSDECAAIRNVDEEIILDHALRALDSGWQVQAEWLLSADLISRLEKLIGPTPPQRIRPLLNDLPPGTRYEHVQLYLRCRERTRHAPP